MPSFYDVNMDCNSLPAGQSGQPYSSQNSSPEFDPERDDRLSEASNSTIIIRVEEGTSTLLFDYLVADLLSSR